MIKFEKLRLIILIYGEIYSILKLCLSISSKYIEIAELIIAKIIKKIPMSAINLVFFVKVPLNRNKFVNILIYKMK